TLRGVQLELGERAGNFAKVWMSKRVITDLVAFSNDAAHQVRIGLPVLANDEERGRYVFAFQNVQNCGGPLFIWAIVKGQRDPSRVVATALNHVRRRRRDKLFTADETAVWI